MAATTDFEGNRAWGRMASLPEAARGGRSNFDRARRHTRTVKLLRWSLPAGAASIVTLYVVSILNTVGWVEGMPQIDIPQIIPENLTMDNPRYEGFNSDGGKYVVTAKTAVQDLTDMSQVKLNGIVGDLTDANKVKTNLKATRGTYNTKTDEMELYDGIDVVSESGMQARLQRATVITKENIVISKEPVVVTIPAGTIRSKGLTMRNKAREVTFSDSVVARLVPDAGKQDGGKDGAPAPKPAAGATPVISAANGPIDVTSNRLDIDDRGKVATFSGGVRAAQADAVLETKALEVHYEGGGTGATSTATGKIKRIASREPVVMTRAPQDRVTAQSLDFDATSEIAQLTGDVVMTSGADRRVTSSAATMNQRSDTILLTGDVVAVQGRNEMKGGRLYLDRASGRTELTSPQGLGAEKPGRISTRFYRGDLQGQVAKNGQPAPAAPLAPAVFKTDPSAPIDVEADRLDVDDRASLAVFKGSVRAVQGDFVVHTAEMRAHYTGQAGIAVAADPNTKSEPAQLTRIEAHGKVLVTSASGQDASGDWANFDVKANKVTLGGDVVLTQEKNVVRGTRLVIDMATGQSIIHNDPGAAWTAKAAPAGQSEDKGFVVQGATPRGRPSAIFYPSEKKGLPTNGAAAGKDSTTGSTDSGGWEARSPAP
jgi:lipopolysaccharide transport protein LptA/LPS export ABC transporter protein LptC